MTKISFKSATLFPADMKNCSSNGNRSLKYIHNVQWEGKKNNIRILIIIDYVVLSLFMESTACYIWMKSQTILDPMDRKSFLWANNGCRQFHDYTHSLCVVIQLRISWMFLECLSGIVAKMRAHAVSGGYIITLSALILGAIYRSIKINDIQFTIRHAEACWIPENLWLNFMFSNDL